MRPAFTADPLAYALFVATVVAWVIGEARQALRRRSNAAKDDRYSLLVLRVCIFIGFSVATYALRITSAAFGYSPFSFGLGLFLFWCGIGVRWWSFWTLGRFFTFAVMTSADQPVITSGPYRVVRHPSYAGFLLALAGVGVSFGNWISLMALLVSAALGFIYRIRVEEAALSAALGERYDTYAAGRKRLIPGVW